jgi:hypothetical protein
MKRGASTTRKKQGLIEPTGSALLMNETALQGKTFWQNILIRISCGVSLVLNAAAWLVLLLLVSSSRDRVILHYNVYLGVDIVGARYQVYWVPAVGLLFWLVNLVLARFLYAHQERIAAYLLLLVNVMLQFGIIIASISIDLVNY